MSGLGDIGSVDLHTGTVLEEPIPLAEPPPEVRLPPREWVKANLFSSPLNTVLTLVFGVLLAYALYRAAVFVLWSGRWELIRVNLTNFMVGRFPRAELWRVWAALVVGGVMLGCAVGIAGRQRSDPGSATVAPRSPATVAPQSPATAAPQPVSRPPLPERRAIALTVSTLLSGAAALLAILALDGATQVVVAVIASVVLGAVAGFELPRPVREWVPVVYVALLVAAAFLVKPPLATEDMLNAGGLFAGVALWRVCVVLALAAAVATAALPSLRPAMPALVAVFALVLLARTTVPALLLIGVAAAGAGGWAVAQTLPRRARRWLPAAYVAALIAAYAVLSQFGGVGYDAWGGVLLTVFVAIAGIVLSFPIGLLLALGRRSTFPAIRVLCVGYIELFRGVPLYTLLLMGAVVIGFFLPRGMTRPELVTRGVVVIVIFTSAYVAEIVRGGLQSVPKGQLEAAQALGIPPLRTLRLVILPQALRAVIPALVGQFISLYKDTSLLVVLSLFEILGVAQAITQQEGFLGQGLQAESLVFASFLFWVACYTMSRASQRLEARLGVGER